MLLLVVKFVSVPPFGTRKAASTNAAMAASFATVKIFCTIPPNLTPR